MSAQSERAFEAANEIKNQRAIERELLRAAPLREKLVAIEEPSEALASYRLSQLFGAHHGSIVPRLGPAILRKLFDRMNGFRVWHTELRLRELTARERQQLAAAIGSWARQHPVAR